MPQIMPMQEKISQGTTGSTEYRLLKSELGNGQQQIAPDGLNYKRQKYNIEWTGLTQVELNTITDILDLTAGWDTLSWTPHGSNTSYKWRMTNGFTWNTQGGDVFSVTTAVEQDFR